MPAQAGYRALLRAAGAPFLILAFLARLPNGMGPLGVLTLVVAGTGSYATAGLAAGALGLGAAVGGPVVGALADRYGQRRVGLATAALDAAGYVVVVLAVTGGAPAPLVAGGAALAGLATPQIGPLARLRWAHLLTDRGTRHLLGTAFSYEGAADEVSFMAGPALVGLCALVAPPEVPLLLAAGLLTVCGVGFALHRTAPPVRHRDAPAGPSARHQRAGAPTRHDATPAEAPAQHHTTPAGAGRRRTAPAEAPRPARMPWAAVAGLVLAMAALGLVFGGTQTGVTALARSAGHEGAAGLVYAVLGVGSATAGLATAWLPHRFSLGARYPTFAGTLAAGTCGLLLVHSVAGAVAVMAVLGVLVAPYLITVYGLAERVAPDGRGGTVLTLMASGIVAGVAAGTAVAGTLADGHGAAGAFVVPVAGGCLALLLALATTRRLRHVERPRAARATESSPALER